MDLSKSYEFFQPESVKERIHIIGCGSVGSTLAELLTRLGLTKISLYDMDIVKEHNLANQLFVLSDVGQAKVDAVAKRMKAINPSVENDLKIYNDGWHGQKLSGYVFLAVDNIELRRKIVEENMQNTFIKGIFDFRTQLTASQHFAANWKKAEEREKLLGTMRFSQAEAEEATELSACNVAMCVMPTVWSCCISGITNFIHMTKGEANKTRICILNETFNYYIGSY